MQTRPSAFSKKIMWPCMASSSAGQSRIRCDPLVPEIKRLRAHTVFGEAGQRRIQPRAGGVDDCPRPDGQNGSGRAVRDGEPRGGARDLGMVQRHASGREPLRVEDQLDAQALGIADPGIVIGRGKAQPRRQRRPVPQCRARAAEAMLRQQATVAGGPVVEHQPDLDRQRTPACRAARQAEESRPPRSTGPRTAS